MENIREPLNAGSGLEMKVGEKNDEAEEEVGSRAAVSCFLIKGDCITSPPATPPE